MAQEMVRKLNRFLIKQIPINFNKRIIGKSKIPRIEIFRTLLNIFKLRIKK